MTGPGAVGSRGGTPGPNYWQVIDSDAPKWPEGAVSIGSVGIPIRWVTLDDLRRGEFSLEAIRSLPIQYGRRKRRVRWAR